MKLKVYKQIHKKLKKEIMKIKKQNPSMSDNDKKYMEITQSVIMEIIFKKEEQENNIRQLSFALSKNNVLMDRLSSKSNLNEFHKFMTEPNGEYMGTELVNEAKRMIERATLENDSYFDFIFISIHLVSLFNLGFAEKLRAFFKNEEWENTPAKKLLLYLDKRNISMNYDSSTKFLEHIELILLVPHNIDFFTSNILKYKYLKKHEIDVLESVQDFLIKNMEEPETGKLFYPDLLWFLDVLISTYTKEEMSYNNEPVYLGIEFVKGKISSSIFLQKFNDIQFSKYNLGNATAIVWSSVVVKLTLAQSQTNKVLFAKLFIRLYETFREKIFDSSLINYIIAAFLGDTILLSAFTSFMCSIFMKDNIILTPLERKIWDHIISYELIKKDEYEMNIKISNKHNLPDYSYKMLYDTLKTKRSNREILKYIDQLSWTIFKVNSLFKAERGIIELEKSKIKKTELKLSDIISMFETEEALAFLRFVIFERYMNNKFIHDDKSKKFMSVISANMAKSAVKLIKKDTNLNSFKQTVLDINKTQPKIDISKLDSAFPFEYLHTYNTTVWKFIHQIKISVDSEAVKLISGKKYLINLIELLAYIKNKPIVEVYDFIEKLRNRKIKIYLLKSHINNMRRDTITEGVLNDDDTIRRILTNDDEIQLVELEAKKAWENNVFWKIIENLSTVFEIVYDNFSLYYAYYYDNEITVNNKEIQIIKSNKIKNGELKIMFDFEGKDE
ncbi:hypothetical protein [Mycoplasma todarodis]|uniref:hypothetical protein n=1 Tax=Mycoplasma todarodis TaxID=1937191 RepID=UPI003B29F74C